MVSISRRGAVLAGCVVTVAVCALVAFGCSPDDEEPLTTDEFCQRLEADRDIIELFGQLETTELEAKRESLDQLAPEAPEAIRAEFTKLVDYIDAAVDALSVVASGDEDAAYVALQPIQDDAAAATEAGHVVEPWVGEHCGFEIRTGSSLPPPTTAPSTEVPSTTPPTTAG